jgi:hypothetical protein
VFLLKVNIPVETNPPTAVDEGAPFLPENLKIEPKLSLEIFIPLDFLAKLLLASA